VANSFTGNWIFRLDAKYERVFHEMRGFSFEAPWLTIDGASGRLTIPIGYAWDGCTPKYRVADLGYVGTPDGTIDPVSGYPKARFASLVHDCLYQYYGSHGVPRRTIDGIFLSMLQEARFSFARLYYLVVRAFGGCFFIGIGIKRVGGRELSRRSR
jgi:hypothetical protein